MRSTALPALLLGLALLLPGLFACSGRWERVDDAAAADPAFLPARALYRNHCIACHGKDGRGSANLFPPLRGSEWATGNPEIPIRIVLHGFQGLLVVSGNRFLNHMMPLGHRLSDEEIAAILTYVRASWGNGASAIQPWDVKQIRLAHADRKTTWSPEELAGLGLATVSGDSSGAAPAHP